jgi:hypothetical protein
MIKYTHEMIDWMRENRPKLLATEFTHAFNQKFDCATNKRALLTRCKAFGIKTGRSGQFQKAHQPHNKGKKGIRLSPSTEFKKGIVPHNTVAIGTEVVDKKDGYTKVKIANPNVWKQKHIIMWEQYHGKLKPKGFAIIFLDCNRTNFSKNNLLLISRAALCVLNKRGLSQQPTLLKPTIIAAAELEVALGKVNRNKDYLCQ